MGIKKEGNSFKNNLFFHFLQAEFTSYACSHQDAISSKIQNCCEKPVLERSKCIFMSENDDKPTGLSPQVRQFIEDQDVCKHFEEKKDVYLAE